MIHLRTGLPGASKTLTAVYELCKLDSVGEVPFYYNNIKYFCLDIEQVSSFGFWLVHIYLNENKENKSIKALVSRIHETGRLVVADDFPDLSNDYQIWLENSGDRDLYIKWVLRAYPTEKTKIFSTYIKEFPLCSLSDLKRFNLYWQYLEDPTLWYRCEHPSIILLDECQRHFSPRPNGSKVPRHVSEFETHRHLGTDIYLITQDAKLIDANVRRLAGSHVHLVNIFGSSRVRRMEMPEVFDPSDYHAAKQSIKSLIKHPKHLYGVYLSSLNHTHKLKLPKKLFVPFFFLALLSFVLFQLYSSLTSKTQVQESSPVASVQEPSSSSSFTVQHISTAKNLVPGCSSVDLAGVSYIESQPIIYLNCYGTEDIAVKIYNFEEDPYEYTYKENRLIDARYLAAFNLSFSILQGALFISDGKQAFFVDFII